MVKVGRDRLEMGATVLITWSIPGLPRPASQAGLLSHIVGPSGSLGYSKLTQGHHCVLRLSTQDQVLLMCDLVTVMVSASPLLTHGAPFPTQHPLPGPPQPP